MVAIRRTTSLGSGTPLPCSAESLMCIFLGAAIRGPLRQYPAWSRLAPFGSLCPLGLFRRRSGWIQTSLRWKVFLKWPIQDTSRSITYMQAGRARRVSKIKQVHNVPRVKLSGPHPISPCHESQRVQDIPIGH